VIGQPGFHDLGYQRVWTLFIPEIRSGGNMQPSISASGCCILAQRAAEGEFR
jgi:hypothetical protein